MRAFSFKYIFCLKFGLANAINDYDNLKIRVVCVNAY